MGKAEERAALIDAYISFDKAEKQAKSDKKECKEELTKLGVDSPGRYEGDVNGAIVVTEATTLVLDASKVRKKLGDKKFMEVINVSMEKLKQHMAPADIDKVVATTETTLKWLVKSI